MIREIVAAAAVDQIIAAAGIVLLVSSIRIVAAEQGVGIGGTDDGIDRAERIVSDRGIAIGSSGRDVDGHASRGADIGYTPKNLTGRIDRADNDVVAAPAFELGKANRGAGNAAGAGEPGSIERIGKVAADRALNVDERIRADPVPDAVPAVRLMETPPVASV